MLCGFIQGGHECSTCTPPGPGCGNPQAHAGEAPMSKPGKAGRRRGGSPGAAPSDRAVGRQHGLGEDEE
eukprot:12092231-Alexandrium_andersonii.AAC.1